MSRQSEITEKIERIEESLREILRRVHPDNKRIRRKASEDDALARERVAISQAMQRAGEGCFDLAVLLVRHLGLEEPKDAYDALRILARVAEPEPPSPSGEPERSGREPIEEAAFMERSPGSGNHRQHPRYAVELDVTLSSEHNFYQGLSENVSAGGIFIATHLIKPIGERLEIVLHLPFGKEPLQAVGEVRWVRAYSETSDVPPGIGLCFVDLEPEALERIEAFLQDREPLFYEE